MNCKAIFRLKGQKMAYPKENPKEQKKKIK